MWNHKNRPRGSAPTLMIRPQNRPVAVFVYDEDILLNGEGAVCAFIGLGDGHFINVVKGCGVFGHLPAFEVFNVFYRVFEGIGPEVTHKDMVALLDVVGFFKTLLHQGMEQFP